MKGPDPKLYRQLAEPFESEDAANEAMHAFQTELYELRVKHRIRDLTFVAQFAVDLPERNEVDCTIVNHYGDQSKKVTGLAFAYGKAFEEHGRYPLQARLRGEEQAKRERVEP